MQFAYLFNFFYLQELFKPSPPSFTFRETTSHKAIVFLWVLTRSGNVSSLNTFSLTCYPLQSCTVQPACPVKTADRNYRTSEVMGHWLCLIWQNSVMDRVLILSQKVLGSKLQYWIASPSGHLWSLPRPKRNFWSLTSNIWFMDHWKSRLFLVFISFSQLLVRWSRQTCQGPCDWHLLLCDI